MMIFHEAFDTYLLNQKVFGWGAAAEERSIANGFSAFSCGYFTAYANGYKLIVSGESLGSTVVQIAMIVNTLDLNGIEL